MRPKELKTKIFLDSGDPEETKEIKNKLGFLDGQTTNPTLISRNPYAKEKIVRGDKFSEAEIWEFYRRVVHEISTIIPDGNISVEVYATKDTTSDKMVEQAREFNNWIPNAQIKLPLIKSGIKAAHECIKERMSVNFTLNFSQEQAAAVHSATKGATPGQVFISPFVGRLDDKQENGMDLVENILNMYNGSQNKHVEVLVASVRTYDHFLRSLQLEADIITAPTKVLLEWYQKGMKLPKSSYEYEYGVLKPIAYSHFDLDQDWESFDINHEQTNIGLQKFSEDWNNLIE